MALLTMTINDATPTLATRAQEVGRIHRALVLAEQQIRAAGGAQTSGTIVDAGTTLGSWTYTPAASS